MKLYTGTKMYRYQDGSDHPEIIRIIDMDYEKKLIKFITQSGDKKKAKHKDITKNYKILAPDAMMSFSTVNMPNGDKDVIVALQPFPKKPGEMPDQFPYVICRQLAADIFSNIMNDPNNPIIGVSISKDTCLPNVDFSCMLACDGIEHTKMVNVYLDDSLDAILGLIDTTIFDSVFDKISARYGMTRGFCHSLKQLLEDNKFMFDFRKCFKIIELPFTITENDLAVEQLSTANTEALAKELNTPIKDTYLLPYSREIDLSQIKRDYVLASCAQDNYSHVYLIGYDKAK